MTSLLDRYLRLLKGSPQDSDGLSALEGAMQQAGDLEALTQALKSRLATVEEREGPQPISLSLRKRTTDTLLLRARQDADDVSAALCAVEAMEMYAHELNDVDALKVAALQALVRNGPDGHVRAAVASRLGGAEYALGAIKRALRKEDNPTRKSALAYAAALYKLDKGDRDGAFVDLMRALRARPSHAPLVDELMRVAMESDRQREAEAVFTEVATAEAVPEPPARAYLLSRIGTLRAHLGMDAEALAVFRRALELDGELKGALKQARRLADRLGVPFEPPLPAPPPPPPPRPAAPVAAPRPSVMVDLGADGPAPSPVSRPQKKLEVTDPEVPQVSSRGRAVPAHLVEPSGPALFSDLPHKVPDPLGLGGQRGSFSISIPELLARSGQGSAVSEEGTGAGPTPGTPREAPAGRASGSPEETTAPGPLSARPSAPVTPSVAAGRAPSAEAAPAEAPFAVAPAAQAPPSPADSPAAGGVSAAPQPEEPAAREEPTSPSAREKTLVVVSDDGPPHAGPPSLNSRDAEPPSALEPLPHPPVLPPEPERLPVVHDERTHVEPTSRFSEEERASGVPVERAATSVTHVEGAPMEPTPITPSAALPADEPTPITRDLRPPHAVRPTPTLVQDPTPISAPPDAVPRAEDPTTDGEPDDVGPELPAPAAPVASAQASEAPHASSTGERTLVSAAPLAPPGTGQPATPPLPPPVERTLVNAAPPEPQTAEDFVRAGMPARAADLLEERVAQNNRVADLLLLADLRERELEDHVGALDAYARAATRLSERSDARDVMLVRAVDGAIRVGAARPAALLKLADALATKVDPAQHGRAVRTAAAALQQDKPADAAAALVRLYGSHPVHHAELFEEADRALGLAQDRRGQAELRSAARERTGDPRLRLLLARERADLLKGGDVRLWAAALRDVLEEDPADGAALEKLLLTLETARKGGQKVDLELAEALALGARLQRGELGLPHVKRLARLCEERAEPGEAVRHWREALSRRPGDADALRALTDLLERLREEPGRAAELMDVLQMRLSIARNRKDRTAELELLWKLAELVGANGDARRRLDLLTDVLALQPDHEAAAAAVESGLEAAGQWEALAEHLADMAARRTRPAGRMTALLAGARVWRDHLQDPARALTALREVLTVDPEHVPTLLAVGELGLGRGEAAASVKPLERAARHLKGPSRAAALVLLGRAHEQLDAEESAQKAYRDALAADGGHRAALEALLSLAERAGRTAEARSVAADLAATETDPARRAEGLWGLARAAVEAGEQDQAVRFLEAALAADASRMDVLEELARVHVERGDGRRARPWLERLVAARGQDAVPPSLLVALARGLWANGDHALAKERLRAALRRDPTLLDALRALADLMLADRDPAAETLAVLDLRLLHHGDRLEPSEAAFVHARAGLLRRSLGDAAAALRNLRRALALGPAERPDPDVLLALAQMVEAEKSDEARALYTRLAQRLGGAAAAAQWVKVGQLAQAAGDADEAVRAYQEARRADPERADAARFLMDAEVARGNGAAAVTALMALLEREADPARQADLHVQLARIHREQLVADDKAAVHLRRALELLPTHKDALFQAEALFLDRKDPRALVGVYTAAIRNLPPDAVEDRAAYWDKVALLRRYELKDLTGAVDALTEMLRLDEAHPKAREDLARLHLEMGSPDKALVHWRMLLSRDPLNVDAYRGMLAIFRRQLMFDAAYCVCATLTALEEADEDTRLVVRQLRPPFPTWPRPAADPEGLMRRLVHARASGVARDLLGAMAAHVLPVFARPHAELGLGPRAELDLDAAPPSFSLAAKHAMRLLGLQRLTLYRSDNAPAGVSLVLSSAPGLWLGADALKGGMTPERAFAFARAAAGLRPENLLVGVLGPARLRQAVEAMVHRAVPAAELEGDRADLDRLAREMERLVPAGEWPRLLLLAREWWRDRASAPLADLPASLQFTADRVGFLFAQDLGAAVSVLKAQGAAGVAPMRAAIRELVLFSVSPELFALRTELGPSVNAVAAARVFGDG